MRTDGRRRRCTAFLALCAMAAGCRAVTDFTRPEGDGGWNSSVRERELAQRAHLAGVDFPAAAEPPPAAPSTAPLDLPTALSLALSGNRRIAAAAQQLDAARARVADSRGRLLPTTIGSGRYTWYTDAQTTNVTLPKSLLPPGVLQPIVKVRDAEAGTLNGTLTLPIDLSGELRHTLAAAQAGFRGEKARYWATTLDQQVLVVRTYFDLLAAQRLHEVTEQTTALYREQLENAQSQYDHGRVTKNQLLVVQVALRNAEERLLQDDIAIEQARWSLNQAVGAAVNAPTEVVDVRRAPLVPATREALQLAYVNNPVLAALLEEQQRLDETVSALERSRLPRFSAGGAADYTSSDLLQPQQIGSAFTGFIWDLGTDTRREAQIAEARADTARNKELIETDMRELEASVRFTQQAAEERLAAFTTAQVAVGQAEENVRIRQQQFTAGRATSEDVLDAEALLAQQRATLATALYQAHTRCAELQQLIGLSLDTEAFAPR